MQYRREKGPCFRCDDKWTVEHWYRRGELGVIITADHSREEEIELEGEKSHEEPVGELHGSTGNIPELGVENR